MNLINSCVLMLLMLLSQASMGTTRKVFFIGNSYTYYNSMPDMLRNFAAAKGDTLIHGMSAPGGHTLMQHTTNTATISGIFSQPWDIVVLQEQSQLPSFPPAQVATDVYPYAAWLDSVIHENDTCTQTMFMMTWGRRNGDVMNCPGYPVVCTYAGMQGRLRESYMQMAQDNDAIVAPMGAAWKLIIDSFPAIDLYIADSSHPSVAGSYLQACVFYASIFHRPAQGCTYLGSLPLATAQTLQRIADKVVLDSLSQWQQYGHYPYVAFSYTPTAFNTLSFNNHSQRATGYFWSFGDGSSDTAANPAHIYSATGTYVVTLTVANDCFTTTVKDTIPVGITTGFSSNGAEPGDITFRQGNGGRVTLLLPANRKCEVLEVYDCTGRLIKRYQVQDATITAEFAPGIYVYRAYAADRSWVRTGKFSAY